LFGRSVGFWSALLFQCLPGSGQVLSDAISDPLFLCLATTALLFGVRAVGNHAPRAFALCGLFSGLAYLVRPEGALVVLATGLVLVGMQAVAHRRRAWGTIGRCGAALMGAALVTASPYYLVTGNFTNKPSASQLSGKISAVL
jgi:4-amino-4-deoxy-L-arabinose transferase-like glycosyltransferase